MPLAKTHQALTHIGSGRNVHAQPVGRVLVNEAPVGARQQPLLRLAHVEHIHKLTGSRQKLHASAVRQAARRNRIEKGRFAGARFTDHRQYFARPKVERCVLQRHAIAVALSDAAHAQKWRRRRHFDSDGHAASVASIALRSARVRTSEFGWLSCLRVWQ